MPHNIAAPGNYNRHTINIERGSHTMRRKHEVIKGRNISVWDDGEKFADRFTVVYLDDTDERGKVPYLAMGATPFHPQGFGQHGEMEIDDVSYKGRDGAFKKRIRFDELPPDCQRAVLNDLIA
jgi:hypothetical protein